MVRSDIERLSASGKYVKTLSQEYKDLAGLVLIKKPSIRFSDLADLKEAKRALIEALLPMINRSIKETWTGILLYGPPGTGKTSLASAAAAEFSSQELSITFIYASFAEIVSKYVGESEKNLAKIFRLAEELAPSIIFFDEIDYLSEKGDTSGVTHKMTLVLQTEMEGLRERDKLVIVLASTNRPWLLTKPLLSRFRKRIYVGLPDKETRKEILVKLAKRLGLTFADDVDLDLIAEKTEYYSGRDLKNLLIESRMIPIRSKIDKLLENNAPGVEILKALRDEQFNVIKMKYLLEALKKIRPSVTPEDLKKYEEWRRKYQEY